jgi:hypothetical protein
MEYCTVTVDEQMDVIEATAHMINLAAIIGTYLGDEPVTRSSGPDYMICWGAEGVEGYVIRLCQFAKRVLVYIDTGSGGGMPDPVWRKCLTIIGCCAFHEHEWRAEPWPGYKQAMGEPA